ncbi:MAG: LPS export ABC transporter periplasmic protein LptC [Candidatus Cloacimonadales bacterium]|nr:LPS export ABC transporter periplasmic protein LptC [Candidatus Cloacimonadota bacterium]MDD2649744.1 LPS export ABC transporter periplasmic protein LptC [Candidatus Cloacimonadota bacterium]MDX9978084.1 LPS export ABC transporter periplasmic protein LptC [Candidatus Cloacimonadales bacterium]
MKALWKLISSILMLIAMLVFNACDLSSNIPYNRSLTKEPATETIDSVFVVATDGNNLEWLLHADKVEKYPDKQFWKAYNVKFESVPTDNSDPTIMTSNEAEIDEISNKITGKGNVIIISPNGLLKTEFLTLNRFNNEVFAPGFVYLEKEDNIIKGTGLTTNVTFDYVNLQQVSGEGTTSDAFFE